VTLVCHPGGPGFSGATLTDLGGLGESVELVTVDPRGTGDRPPVDTYSQGDYVADLEQLRDELGLEQFDLLGHSHGGFVAIAYAATYPQRVRKLVLAATAARLAPEHRAAAQQMWEDTGDPTVAQALAARKQRLSSPDLPPDEFVRLVMIELRLYFAKPDGVPVMGRVYEHHPPNLDALAYFNRVTAPTFDLRPQLPAIAADTLVITGDHHFLGPPAADELVAGIPRARRVVLEDAGHYLWIDQPEAFASEVREFLRQ
jgi:pimeloyl-ACP methyl ester carboxylesterase